MNKYFLPKNYIENPVITFNNEEGMDYWNEQRIESSKKFQFHVYALAAEIFRRHKFKSIADFGSGPGTKTRMFFHDIASEVHLFDQPDTEKVAQSIYPEACFTAINLDSVNQDSDRTYDMIICADVIEHLRDPDILLDTLYSHMNEKSILVLSTPDRDMRRGVNNLQSPNQYHVREWNMQELSMYVQHKGFELIDRKNVPLDKQESFFYQLLNQLLYRKIFRSRWFACQTLILKKK